jgi:hypothetical protein
MKKNKVFSLILACLIISLSSFFIGYYLIQGKGQEKPQKDIMQSELDEKKPEDNDKDYEIATQPDEEELIGPYTVIEIITYYKECGHFISKVEKADSKIINMNEEEFKSYIHNINKDWRMVLFTHERVIIEEEREHLCPNHFIIGVEGDRIAIFKINEEGERVLYKIVDVEITMLKEIDQEKLKKGIVIDSEEEIGDVLENFIS